MGSPFVPLSADPFQPPEPGPGLVYGAVELPAIVIPVPPPPPPQPDPQRPRERPRPGNGFNNVPEPNLPPPPSANFPRRALVIGVSNYAYLTPVASGPQGRDLNAFTDLLSRGWSIPATQVFQVSDVGQQPRPPRKEQIEAAITSFVDTSRAQDRIVLCFVGHAAEVEDTPYLVPIDGRLEDKASLIPLSWVYGQLGKCKARQKILLLDVCRSNPLAGDLRTSGPAMGDKFEAALKAPPAGVQVWSACSAGQRSYEAEFYANNNRTGQYYGVFLELFMEAMRRINEVVPTVQNPPDAIPLEAVAKMVNERVKAVAAELPAAQPLEQLPLVAGAEAAGGAPFNALEPPAAPVDVPPLTVAAEFLPLAEVEAILKQIEMPPILVARQGNLGALRPDALPLFPAKVGTDYRDEIGFSPFRATLKEVMSVLNRELGSKRFPETFAKVGNQTDDQFKATVLEIERNVAKTILILQEALDALDKAGGQRDQETSKRWRVIYDYVSARLRLSMAYLIEYQSRLGDMRREMPERDPAKHQGWRVSSVERMSGDKQGRDLVKDAKKILDTIIAEHPNTPWAALAEHDKQTHLGLKWQGARLR
jgi:hypothetical protein